MTAATISRTRPDRLKFELPPSLEAREPPEARGLTRDGVRMMVASRSGGCLVHSPFRSLPSFLDPGDLVVVNTSAVIPAAVDGFAPDGSRLVIHLSTQLDERRWVVEPRRPTPDTTERWVGALPRDLQLGVGASIRLMDRYLDSSRLWIAELTLPQPVFAWLAVNGQPIRYSYVDRPWPISA